jgi:glycosyltransferase involved in cell wall biosynthesis
MSNIPPFLEHMAAHHVYAEVFNPRSPEEIAEKLNFMLSNPEEIKAKAQESQKAISHFTWERSAEGYLTIFDEILSSKSWSEK